MSDTAPKHTFRIIYMDKTFTDVRADRAAVTNGALSVAMFVADDEAPTGSRLVANVPQSSGAIVVRVEETDENTEEQEDQS